MSRVPVCPTDEIERSLCVDSSLVCGIDEVGRGAWAGPLVMACVIPGKGTINGVRDSKKVSEKNRVRLAQEIALWSDGIGIGIVSNNEIDEIGMSRALKECAHRSIVDLENNGYKADKILLDGHYDFVQSKKHQTTTVVKGDDKSHLIAAASIVAKVYRDSYMASQEVSGIYPEFYFEKNKGYPSPVHKEALKVYGPTPLHRISWKILDPISQDLIAQPLF